jgi:hypothetical protein
MRYILYILISFLTINCVKASEDLFYPERIHLHVSKNIFIAGEVLWFKAYNINLSSRKLSNQSSVAYVELINSDGIPLVKESFILKNGIGQGCFLINNQLPSGIYSLNVYTHWSKSISKDLISITPVYVFNNNSRENNRKYHPKLKKVKQLKTNKWTTLNCEKSNSIQIKVQLEDLERMISIAISHKDSTKITSPEFTLRFSTYKKDAKEYKFRFVYGKWEKQIKLSDLKDHIYALSLSDEQENLIFKHAFCVRKLWDKSRIDEPRLMLATRTAKSIRFKQNHFSTEGDTLYLSASIRKKEPVQNSFNMINFLNFHMHFNHEASTIESSALTPKNKSWIGPVNIVPFSSQLESNYSENHYQYIENESYILEGQIVNKNDKQSLPNQEVFLTKIGEFVDMQSNLTNQYGQFYFKLPLLSGLHDISLQFLSNDSTEYEYILKEKFNKTGILYPNEFYTISNEQNFRFVKEQWENQKIREIYDQKQFKHLKDSIIYRGKSNFFGDPKIKIKLDEYIRLDSLKEYFHELISHVKVRYKEKKTAINVFNADELRLMHRKSLLLFDGLIISNPSKILSKNSRDIERIEVVPYEYFYRGSHFYGIVHIISKNKNCEISELPFNTERYYLPLFMKKYKQVKKWNAKKNYPDFRTDLLWKPDLVVTKSNDIILNFTTSDVIGEYELIVEGISNKGEPIVLKKDITIK